MEERPKSIEPREDEEQIQQNFSLEIRSADLTQNQTKNNHTNGGYR